MEANEIKESAQKRKEKAVKLYKDKESELTALLDPLGKNELEIVKSFAEFSDIIEKISDKPDFNVHFKENGISDIKIQKIGDLNLKDLSIWADTALASLSGAAAGVAGGFAASGGNNSSSCSIWHGIYRDSNFDIKWSRINKRNFSMFGWR